MSKSLQIYYNAIFGAIGGLLGWLLVGSFSTGSWHILAAYAFVGAGVGLCIGALAGMVDGAVIKRSPRRAAIGAGLGAAAGLVSGVLGLLISEGVFLAIGGGIIGRTLGWLLLGLFLGVGEGVIMKSRKRKWYGGIGGTLGGALGGLLYEGMTQAFLAHGDTVQMIVGAIGLMLIGASLGAIIPLAGDIMGGKGKLCVRSGKRKDVEVTIVDDVLIGSYDGCGLYLPGDPAVAPKHAVVRVAGTQLFLEDLGTPGGTFVNGARIPAGGTVEVKRGATIQIGATSVELV